jgi:hypothetical protein
MSSSVKRVNAQLGVIYDTYRTALLNKLYYGAKLERYQKINMWLEILIAIGATTSGVAGFQLWKIQPYGPIAWGAYALLVAVLATAKPFLQLSKAIERYSKLHTGHLYNSLALYKLIAKIRSEQALTREVIGQFELALQQHVEFSRDDDPVVDRKLQERCEAKVRMEVPQSSLWWATEGQP